MKPIAWLGSIVALALAAALLLSRDNHRFERRIAELQRRVDHDVVVRAAQMSPRPTAARPSLGAIPISARVAPDNDPDHGPIALDLFRNAGRDTPAAAFQTVIWTALHGDPQELSRLFTLTKSARARVVALLDNLPPDARQEYPSPEALVGLFFARSMLNDPSRNAQITGWLQQNPTTADLYVNFDGQSGAELIPMQREQDGWTVIIPDHAVGKIERQLGAPAAN